MYTRLVVIFVLGLVSCAICQPGAPSAADINNEKIQSMAAFAVGEMGSEYELLNVVSATQQVVNGMIYNIDLVARRNINGQADKRRSCKVMVYEILHQGYLELEEFHCHFANKQPRL